MTHPIQRRERLDEIHWLCLFQSKGVLSGLQLTQKPTRFGKSYRYYRMKKGTFQPRLNPLLSLGETENFKANIQNMVKC